MASTYELIAELRARLIEEPQTPEAIKAIAAIHLRYSPFAGPVPKARDGMRVS